MDERARRLAIADRMEAKAKTQAGGPSELNPSDASWAGILMRAAQLIRADPLGPAAADLVKDWPEVA